MSLLRKIPRTLLVIAGVVLFGLARAPFEDRLNEQLIESRLLLPPPGQSALDQMSQSALMGTLGGLRTLVASFMTLQAYEHFSNKNWEGLRQAYLVITSLEPREEEHWVSVVWHLGINATANMQIDSTLPAFERERRFKEYIFQAIELAEKGIEQLPRSVEIRKQLAEVYREKLKDNCATARVYGEIMDLDGAPSYARRFHGYFMARCPGKEQVAYEFLIGLYHEGEYNHLPTLIHEIIKLEGILAIPSSQRIPEKDPDNNPSRRPQKPNNVLPGGIVVP
tara:strand:+ start:1104 stop:1943 length:840 start_codon:yes stop_codon:yes gene_type:complete